MPGLLTGLRLLLHGGVDTRLVWVRLWAARRRTMGLTLGAAVVAVAASFLVPYWYQAGATLVVDTGQQMNLGGAGGGGLGGAGGGLGLAAQFGFGSGGGPTNPQFYEALLKSRSLQQHVTEAEFPLGEQGALLTLAQYWSRKEHPDARDQRRAVKILGRHLETTTNPRTGMVTFKLDGPSKTVAKLMADTAFAALNQLAITIRRRRATAERQFLEGRWQALSDSLQGREDALRRFYERNRNVASRELQFEEARLRRDVERVQGVYAQLGSQLEQARIQEVRDTPALTAVDPAIEPVMRSAPVRKLWALTAAILGAALALLVAMAESANLQLQALRLQPAAMRRSEQG